MLARSWIAILLLANYLLVAGLGCMNRPDDQHELVLIQTETSGYYQECRYIRMDGLEDFINESLASRYQDAPAIPKHHLISVVCGVDAHCLPCLVWPFSTPFHHAVATPLADYQIGHSSGIIRAVYPPPRLE